MKIAGPKAEGYAKFRLKVGGDTDRDIQRILECRVILDKSDVLIADANTGWTMHKAARAVNAVRDLDVDIEQRCRTYEECLAMRQKTPLPIVPDEVIDSLHMLLCGLEGLAFDAINLKISKAG